MCPLKPDIVLYGLANKDVQISNEILKRYGVNRSRIVSSYISETHYMDELNVIGKSRILDSNTEIVEEYDFKALLNLPYYCESDIKQRESQLDNVKIIVDILAGKRDDAYVDLICLNAGNILQLSGIVDTIENGYYISKEHIQSGKAINKLIEIVQESNGNIGKLEKFL